MLWIHAWRIIAAMTDHLVWLKRRAGVLFPCPSVNADRLRASRERAITVFVSLAHPQPASSLVARLVESFFNSFGDRYFRRSHTVSAYFTAV